MEELQKRGPRHFLHLGKWGKKRGAPVPPFALLMALNVLWFVWGWESDRRGRRATKQDLAADLNWNERELRRAFKFEPRDRNKNRTPPARFEHICKRATEIVEEPRATTYFKNLEAIFSDISKTCTPDFWVRISEKLETDIQFKSEAEKFEFFRIDLHDLMMTADQRARVAGVLIEYTWYMDQKNQYEGIKPSADLDPILMMVKRNNKYWRLGPDQYRMDLRQKIDKDTARGEEWMDEIKPKLFSNDELLNNPVFQARCRASSPYLTLPLSDAEYDARTKRVLALPPEISPSEFWNKEHEVGMRWVCHTFVTPKSNNKVIEH